MEQFKTLVWKDRSKYGFRFSVVVVDQLWEACIPTLMPMTATMEGLQELNPKIDLSEVKMITVMLENVEDEEVNEEFLGRKIKFAEDNEIQYFQDFSFHKGIPSDVEFTVKDFANSKEYWLTGIGYGVVGDNHYGNGSICISAKDLLEHGCDPDEDCGHPERKEGFCPVCEDNETLEQMGR